MRRRLDERFAHDLVIGRHPTWRLIGDRGAELSIDLGRMVTLGLADLREEIAQGQVVARYSLEGSDGTRWRPLSTGATIGCRKLDRLPPTRVRRIRLRIDDALEAPAPIRLGLYAS